VGNLLAADLLDQAGFAAGRQATGLPEVDPGRLAGLLGRGEAVEDRLLAERVLVEHHGEVDVRLDLLVGRQELLGPQVADVDVAADVEVDVAGRARGRRGRGARCGCGGGARGRRRRGGSGRRRGRGGRRPTRGRRGG